jgi:hypothetical protein
VHHRLYGPGSNFRWHRRGLCRSYIPGVPVAAKQRQEIGQLSRPCIQNSFRQEQPTAGYLPDPGVRLPSLYLPVKQNMQPEEAEDTLFKNWGW